MVVLVLVGVLVVKLVVMTLQREQAPRDRAAESKERIKKRR